MNEPLPTVGAIVGSAFSLDFVEALNGREVRIDTPWGGWRLWEVMADTGTALLSYRHEIPHRFLPNQIPYRAQAIALARAGCRSLLVTSSVGVLDPELPLYQPLLVGDILTMDNRLPDGTACTLFDERSDHHAHLVLKEGLLSRRLTATVADMCKEEGAPACQGIVFGYAGGPRTKTAAENRAWRLLGAQVNSMTVAPEVILANELEIPCAVLAVGHKYSLPSGTEMIDNASIARSLEESERATRRIVSRFLQSARPVPFLNELYRFR